MSAFPTVSVIYVGCNVDWYPKFDANRYIDLFLIKKIISMQSNFSKKVLLHITVVQLCNTFNNLEKIAHISSENISDI